MLISNFMKLYKLLDEIWPCPDSTLLSKYIIDIETMRARELRNLLISKLKYNTYSISKILDRQELKVLALNELIKRQNLINSDYFKAELFKLIIFIIILVIILLLLKPLIHILYALLNQFYEIKYQIQIKCNMLLVSYQNKYYLALIAFFISMFLDVLGPAIQYSIVANWLGFPKLIRTFSLPVNPAMVFGVSNNASSSQISKTLGNFSLDFGPMITIFVIGFVKNWLNDYGASKLIYLAKAKEERKEKRREKRREKENASTFESHLKNLDKKDDNIKNPWYKEKSDKNNIWQDDDDDIINELLRDSNNSKQQEDNIKDNIINEID